LINVESFSQAMLVPPDSWWKYTLRVLPLADSQFTVLWRFERFFSAWVTYWEEVCEVATGITKLVEALQRIGII
jgi:hypothetical protein